MKIIRYIFLLLILGTLAFIGYQLYLIAQNTSQNSSTQSSTVKVNEQTQASPTPTIATVTTGTVAGKLCYPSEMIPPLTVFLKEVNTNTVVKQDFPQNTSTFNISNVIPGKYIAFAYLQSSKTGGGSYSAAVPCGLTVSCTDHSSIEFSVQANSSVTGIDICDWYSPNDVPAYPN